MTDGLLDGWMDKWIRLSVKCRCTAYGVGGRVLHLSQIRSVVLTSAVGVAGQNFRSHRSWRLSKLAPPDFLTRSSERRDAALGAYFVQRSGNCDSFQVHSAATLT